MFSLSKKITDKLWDILQASSFPKVISLVNEQKKLDILRIITGLIITERTYFIFCTTAHFYPTGHLHAYAGLALLLCIAFTFGFLTPLTTLALWFFYTYMERAINAKTLGTNVLSMLFIILFLSNCGIRYSIDALLLNNTRFPRVSRAVARVYQLLAFPNEKQLSVIYFLGFLAYATLSFGAIILHVQDPYWVQGYTSSAMLSNSYLSSHYSLFRWLEFNFPLLTRWFSISASVFQSVFQVLMIPLMFFRIGRTFVIIYGLFFFTISFLFLQLSYLPAIEFVLWACLFYRGNAIPKAKQWFASFLNRFSALAGTTTHYITASNTGRKNLLISIWAFVLFFFTIKLAADTLKIDYSGFTRFNHYSHLMLYWAGMEVPNVFNKTDLSMGDKWRVIYRRPVHQAEKELVPLNGLDGERLSYFKYDMVYFGNDLRHRRGSITEDPAVFNRKGMPGYYRNTVPFVKFDYRFTRQKDTVVYTVLNYYSRSSNIQIPVTERYKPHLASQMDIYVYNGEVVNVIEPAR